MVYFVKYVSYVCRRLGTHGVFCEVCFLCLQTTRYGMVYFVKYVLLCLQTTRYDMVNFVKYVSYVCRRLGTVWCTL